MSTFLSMLKLFGLTILFIGAMYALLRLYKWRNGGKWPWQG